MAIRALYIYRVQSVHLKGQYMKLSIRGSVVLLSMLTLGTAQAWQGGSHQRGGWAVNHHHAHRGAHWWAPALVSGVFLGAAVAASAAHAQPVVVTVPVPMYRSAPVYMTSPTYQTYQYIDPSPTIIYHSLPTTQPVGYYCQTSEQFYPRVPTCDVPWRLI